MPRIVLPTPDAIDEAADVLRHGGVVAFPTETVYGLGASTFDETALERVYALKGRPFDNPLIAHVLDAGGAAALAASWGVREQGLAERFWPGPLTLVVRKAEGVPAQATAGLPTIAVRSPAHRTARALLAAFGGPISAPSANRSGHVSATTAPAVADDFAEADDLLVLDGGAAAVGLESTVLDLTSDPPRILRPGSIGEPEIRELLPVVVAPRTEAQAASPGTSPRHYAPSVPARLVEPEALVASLPTAGAPFAVLCFDAEKVPPPHRPIEMPQGAGHYARRLYRALREAEGMRPALILIERPPSSNPLWLAIIDRLERATSEE
jgi:L-threonylcarbamoyladenylate synthase